MNTLWKILEKAERLCRSTYGRYHPLTAKLNVNIGQALETRSSELNQTDAVVSDDCLYQAYDRYVENLRIATEVFGTEHDKTERARSILRQATYVWIANNPRPAKAVKLDDAS